MQTVIQILESVQLKWEHFQTWTEFSRLHLSNKLAIFGVGYNTRWCEDVRYHYAEISSQVPLGKRLREFFNPEKPEGRVVMTKVQKMNWKNVYYKFLDITISEARCLELHMDVVWVPVLQSQLMGSKVSAHYLLPGDLPRTHGLYAIGYESLLACNTTIQTTVHAKLEEGSLPQSGSENGSEQSDGGSRQADRTGPKITYCYLGIAEDRTIQQGLFQHFQGCGKQYVHGKLSGVTQFLQENCRGTRTSQDDESSQNPPRFAIYIKFIEVELDFLSAGSLVECLESAVGYSLKFNNKEAL